MGSRPNPRGKYNNAIQQEFHILARADVVGLLDWRTLVAWIVCRRLAFEESTDNVTPDRRFCIIDFWPDEGALVNNIWGTNEAEGLVAVLPEAQLAYDRGNNLVRLSNDVLGELETGTVAQRRRKATERSYQELTMTRIWSFSSV